MNNSSDIVDGNTSSMAALTGDPGADGFAFLLDTHLADAGYYVVTVNQEAQASFRLDPNAPPRAQSGTGPILMVPGNIAGSVLYFPYIQR